LSDSKSGYPMSESIKDEGAQSAGADKKAMSGKGSMPHLASMLYPGNVTRLPRIPAVHRASLLSSADNSLRWASKLCSVNRLLPLSLEESGAKNFLFASLVKTSAVSRKRLFASALPIRQVIRQTPVCLAPAELNPFLHQVEIIRSGVSRQKGTSPEVSGPVIGKEKNYRYSVLKKGQKKQIRPDVSERIGDKKEKRTHSNDELVFRLWDYKKSLNRSRMINTNLYTCFGVIV
jgi:hypothetical protein